MSSADRPGPRPWVFRCALSGAACAAGAAAATAGGGIKPNKSSMAHGALSLQEILLLLLLLLLLLPLLLLPLPRLLPLLPLPMPLPMVKHTRAITPRIMVLQHLVIRTKENCERKQQLKQEDKNKTKTTTEKRLCQDSL